MAKKIERGLDGDGVGLDLEQLVRRLELLVDTARRFHVALAEGADHGLDLRSDDVRVNAHTADAAELEERVDKDVVPRVEVEIGLRDDASRLDEVVIRLLDRPDGRDLREGDDRLRLDVDHDAAGDVVDDDPEQLEPLVIGESGTLPGRPGDDEPVGTTLDEVLREFAEALEVDGTVGPEGRDNGGQDLA